MLEPFPVRACVLLAVFFPCLLFGENAGTRAEWPVIETPTFSTRGSLGGKDVKVNITPTDKSLFKNGPSAAMSLRTDISATGAADKSRRTLTLPLPVSKKRRVGYSVSVSLDTPAEKDIQLQLTGKSRANPKARIQLRNIKGGTLKAPLPTRGLSAKRVLSGSYEFLGDEDTVMLAIPAGAVSTSFTVETSTASQRGNVEFTMTASTAAQSVASEPPLAPFANWTLPGREPGITLFSTGPAFPGLTFTDPSGMVAHPVEDKFFVSERGGRIYLINNVESTTVKALVLDLSANVAMMNESGLYSFVLHPKFMENGYAYLYYTWKENGASNEPMANPGFNGKYQRLSRFTYNFTTQVFNPSSEQILIQFQAVNSDHRGGGMAFDSHGFLNLAIGEQLVVGCHNAISSEFLSGIVRLDVDQRGGAVSHPARRRLGWQVGKAAEISGVGYFVPSNNPFLDPEGGIFEEFYCIGVRNPYRLFHDAVSNRTWYSEVGDEVEELNLVQSGANFQYPFAEGKNAGTEVPDGVQLGFESPATISFSREESACIIAGFIYRGSKFPSLQGKMIAGDFARSTIWAVEYDGTTGESRKEVISHLFSIVGFAEDPRHGEIFCFSGVGGGGHVTTIYKLKANMVVSNPPSTLSTTGFFQNLSTLEAVPGVRSYQVNMPLWSDGAAKRRWIGLPSDGVHDDPATEQITFSTTGNYRFPAGTVFCKHFELPGRKIETRLLVSAYDGDWYGLSYRWRADGSDADLVTASGLTETVSVGGQTYRWRFPSRHECFSCHSAQSGFVLGFRTSQLNSEGYPSTPGYSPNYLAELSNHGYFDQVVTENILAESPRSANGWDDPNASLGHKVRSYLDSNCAYCHQPGAHAGRASWDARLGTSLAATGLVMKHPIDNLGVSGSKIVMPGAPQGSILLHRMNSVHTAHAMPPLGKDRVDQEAVVKVAEWIKSLGPKSADAIGTKIVRSAADLDLLGTFPYAINFGGPPTVVGPVSFTSIEVPGVSVEAQHTIGAWESLPNLGSSPADIGLATVFHSINVSSHPVPVTIRFSDLVPNRRYKLQLLFMERGSDRVFRVSVNGAEIETVYTLAAQGNTMDGTAGSALVYEFLADSPLLTIVLSGTGVRHPDPIISGLTLEDLGDGTQTLDSDGDALIDAWETLYASNLTTLGPGDSDGDGQADSVEFAVGTNPRDPQDVLSATLSLSPPNLSVQWRSELGTVYRVLWSDDLSTWTPSSPEISGTGEILSWPITLEPTLDRGFFKVETIVPGTW